MTTVITVGKEEKRQFKKFESDGYNIVITGDIDEIAKKSEKKKIKGMIAETFGIVRQEIKKQKAIDSKMAESKD